MFLKDWKIKTLSHPLPCCLESIKARFQGSTKTETRWHLWGVAKQQQSRPNVKAGWEVRRRGRSATALVLTGSQSSISCKWSHDPILMEKAGQLASGLGVANFKANSGWLERWKTRNGIQFKKQHGEKQDADDFGAERWVTEVLPAIFGGLQRENLFAKIINNNIITQWKVQWQVARGSINSISAGHLCQYN